LLVCLTFLFAICSAVETAEQQSGGCSICQLVVSYVEAYVQQNNTETEIIQKLEALCANIPLFGPECDSVVSSYTPQIIKWVINKEPPAVFCLSVGICTSSKAPKVVSTVPCSLCQLAATYVEKWVSEQSTEQEIAQKLESFCSIVGPIAPECESFVATYIPKLIDWVVSKENPQEFCSQVGVCSSVTEKGFFTYKGKLAKIVKRVVEEEEELFEEEQSSGCQVCQLIVTYVEQLVAANTTVSKIVTDVDEMCALLGPNLSPLCDQIAAKYVPLLVQWIIKKENPQAFCAQVGLC